MCIASQKLQSVLHLTFQPVIMHDIQQEIQILQSDKLGASSTTIQRALYPSHALDRAASSLTARGALWPQLLEQGPRKF